MKLIHGDIWDYHAKGDVIAITTGGMVTRKGVCLMPRGCARQASLRFHGIPGELGKRIKAGGLHVYLLSDRIVAFPIEYSPMDLPDTRLIEQSCRELVTLCDEQQWDAVYLPRPGCGSGGLQWSEVEPILQRHLDDRFRIIDRTPSDTGAARC
ncbi:hypothetical protein [Coraliomargarita parva]|uniref:hypothetical protein n=1 Tax=Coraliomargarita parva TaxID=3014050 RepID=UPI0022B48173|nr:hypothetical protein [Coraliomargarita parva]